MTQRYPLPLTPAMLARANVNEAKPRYDNPANVAADWHGGDFGNDIDHAEATQSVASSASAAIGTDYDPQHQEAKGKDMVPQLTPLADIGKDYGPYAGGQYRSGTIAPRAPYPSVLP